MEAGVDLSFRTPFRERFAATSLIQIGGRGNRNFEWAEGTTAHDFIVSHVQGLKQHPAAKVPADVLADLFKDGRLDGIVDPAELVTLAMRREIRRRKLGGNELLNAERECRYPEAAQLGRVIDTDTRLVVVDALLRDRIVARERVTTREVLFGSVQVWAYKITLLRLQPLPGRQEIYWWPYDYDNAFLGYMAGALRLESVSTGEVQII
jgi:CRISPR-associated endonuclease/helicase Cas3